MECSDLANDINGTHSFDIFVHVCMYPVVDYIVPLSVKCLIVSTRPPVLSGANKRG